MRSSNPVLARLTPEIRAAYRTAPAGYPTAPAYSLPGDTATTDQMTVDDVVVRTVGLLMLTGLSGALTWALVHDTKTLFGVWIVSAMVGLGLGLVISFMRLASPALIMTYAVVEGVFVGAVSKAYNSWSSGIIVQAVVGTFGIFLVMSALYRFRVIRSSPRFARGLTAAVVGVFAIIVVNFVLRLFGIDTTLRGDAHGNGTTLSVIFSLVVIVIAALTFILDFDLIEQSVRSGAPRQVAWTCAFGLLVGLIWVYLEVLRLLSYLRGRN